MSIQLPRVHAFEIHDSSACPTLVRESIVESLGMALRWGQIYAPVAPLFARFCERTGSRRILDLCSGSGEPVSILLEAMARQRAASPRFVLSDLFPNPEAMRRVAFRHPGHIEISLTPLDARDVPAHLDGDARTIVSAFHHFPPPLARSILADCVRKRRPVFVLEPCPRNPLRIAALALAYGAASLINPLVARRRRLTKALLTYAAPLLPAAQLWDGTVSVLRMYTKAELFELVAPLGDDFEWTYHAIPLRLGSVATVFQGVPRQT